MNEARPERGGLSCWAAAHANTPAGWQVGRPGYVDRDRQWRIHAFDPTEVPADGTPSREWTAVGRTELHCLQEWHGCLAELKAGRRPK